jgi:hypothetical protein
MIAGVIVLRGRCGLRVPAVTTSPCLYFWHANAFASSSVKNVSLRRGDFRAAALFFDFGNTNETYQVLRGSNDIEALTQIQSNYSAAKGPVLKLPSATIGND